MLKNYRILKKLNPKSDYKPLAVPRIITIFQSCVKHQIQDTLIQRLNFNDLHLLLISLDIIEIRQAISQIKRSKSNGQEVKELAPEEAVKFLKGGGI